jgi:hypothetical protein
MRISSRNLPIEYYILDDRRLDARQAEGSVVGYLADRPIAGTVVDASGHRYRYAGLAPRLSDGRFDVGSLRPGEWIVKPGLIYTADDGVSSPQGK